MATRCPLSGARLVRIGDGLGGDHCAVDSLRSARHFWMLPWTFRPTQEPHASIVGIIGSLSSRLLHSLFFFVWNNYGIGTCVMTPPGSHGTPLVRILTEVQPWSRRDSHLCKQSSCDQWYGQTPEKGLYPVRILGKPSSPTAHVM